jgi:hypothetical protein
MAVAMLGVMALGAGLFVWVFARDDGEKPLILSQPTQRVLCQGSTTTTIVMHAPGATIKIQC